MSEDTPAVFMAEKTVAVDQDWTFLTGGVLQIVLALETDEGVTREGLALRGKVRSDLPNANLLLQLEFPQEGRTDRAIDRIEWRPIQNTHRNDPRGPCGHLHEMLIQGSHRHSFECNWLKDEGRLLLTNLPIAEALTPDPDNFADVLALAAKCFRINNLSDYVSDPWEKDTGGKLLL